MKTSTAGLNTHFRFRSLNQLIELLSSMRFAIAILVLIGLASMIGTFVKQAETPLFYIERYGIFWFEVFRLLSIAHVYSALWFVSALCLLLVSVCLCLYRYTPKMWRDYQRFSFNLKIDQLRRLPHTELTHNDSFEVVQTREIKNLKQSGFRYRFKQLDTNTLLITAKKGALKRLGYVLAHASIILIVLGAMLDGSLMNRWNIAWHKLTPITPDALSTTQLTNSHYLPINNLSLRSSLWIAESQSSSTALVNTEQGFLLQPLPFALELESFHVDYYSTGMPKAFISNVIVHPRDGSPFKRSIEVNKPLHYQGYAIYQASFEDGGSLLSLHARTLEKSKEDDTQIIHLNVDGAPLALDNGAQMNINEFRAINVENKQRLGNEPIATETPETLSSSLTGALQSKDKEFTQMGPSFTYTITANTGEQTQFKNYAYPVYLEGAYQFLFGVKTVHDNDFKYLKIPADTQTSLDDFLRLQRALSNQTLRQQALTNYLNSQVDLTATQKKPLQQLSSLLLNFFSQPSNAGALADLSSWIESKTTAENREKNAQLFLNIIRANLFEVLNLARQKDGLSQLPNNEQTAQWLHLAVLALSDLSSYPSDRLWLLQDFKEIKASVFQIAKAPGTPLVYFGSLILLIGIGLMFYIREQKRWILLSRKREEYQETTHVIVANDD